MHSDLGPNCSSPPLLFILPRSNLCNKTGKSPEEEEALLLGGNRSKDKEKEPPSPASVLAMAETKAQAQLEATVAKLEVDLEAQRMDWRAAVSAEDVTAAAAAQVGKEGIILRIVGVSSL